MNDFNNDKLVYQESVEVWMVDLDTVISEARKRAEELEGEARSERLAEIEAMEQRKNDFRAKFDEFKENTSDAWEEVKEGFENSWNDLKEGFKDARQSWK